MIVAAPITENPSCSCNLHDWFDTFVAQLRVDEILLVTGTASNDKENFYNSITSGDVISLAEMTRSASSRIFINHIIVDYLRELKLRNCKPVSISFNFSDAKVLVWAVIQDNDELTEDNLLLAEAKVNAEYFKFGFHLSSTILETSDKYPVPPQYKSVLLN